MGLDPGELRADRYREIARELRILAFKQVPFELCRQAQLQALAEGFERLADRVEAEIKEKAAD